MVFAFLVWNRVWFWQGTCLFISRYFDIDQGHSDRFKWCIVQTEASPGKPSSNVKTIGCRFSGSGLKRGLKNHIFWSEIGSAFWEPCGTPPPCWGVPPTPLGGAQALLTVECCGFLYALEMRDFINRHKLSSRYTFWLDFLLHCRMFLRRFVMPFSSIYVYSEVHHRF